jgi:RNA polymerase sigma-70 factor (ECF subfamily)
MFEGAREPDAALLHRYLAGDRAGAEALFERHQETLRRYLLRRLGDRDLSEESLQETFVRLLERAPALVEHPRIEAWLFAVARNVSSDVLRRRRAAAASLTSLTGDGLELVLEDRSGVRPEGKLESHELNRLIVKAIERLPAAEREVFFLRTQSMLTFREIALRLDAPLNTVLSRMHRAMNRIRKAMARGGWISRAGTARTRSNRAVWEEGS